VNARKLIEAESPKGVLRSLRSGPVAFATLAVGATFTFHEAKAKWMNGLWRKDGYLSARPALKPEIGRFSIHAPLDTLVVPVSSKAHVA